MEFAGEFETEMERDELWNYFTDPDVLADCAPGCKEMALVSPSEVDAVLSVGVGSVKPTFDVDVTVTQADRPEVLEMVASGADNRSSFETVAEMVLVENGDGTTAEWRAEANVSGLIASLGQRALGSVTNRLVNNFFENVEAKAEEGVEAECQLEAEPDAEATLE
jgi:carbon monoxide dehydrogenase subunit G